MSMLEDQNGSLVPSVKVQVDVFVTIAEVGELHCRVEPIIPHYNSASCVLELVQWVVLLVKVKVTPKERENYPDELHGLFLRQISHYAHLPIVM